MVGAYGEQLLEWLNKHTFPTERRYEDLEYAREMSAFFIKQLLRNGTTTALVFGTVHPQSVDALFSDEQILTALDNALNEISSAAYAIRILAETINNQPESLIRGRSVLLADAEIQIMSTIT